MPNLYELLLPSNQRTAKFYVGNKIDQTEGTTLLDTLLPGKSNSGHDTYGVFTDEQRWQLVEYLKFSRGDAPGYVDYGRWPIGLLVTFTLHPSNFSLQTSSNPPFAPRALAGGGAGGSRE
jgi:hypothetical protein